MADVDVTVVVVRVTVTACDILNVVCNKQIVSKDYHFHSFAVRNVWSVGSGRKVAIFDRRCVLLSATSTWGGVTRLKTDKNSAADAAGRALGRALHPQSNENTLTTQTIVNERKSRPSEETLHGRAQRRERTCCTSCTALPNQEKNGMTRSVAKSISFDDWIRLTALSVSSKQSNEACEACA